MHSFPVTAHPERLMEPRQKCMIEDGTCVNAAVLIDVVVCCPEHGEKRNCTCTRHVDVIREMITQGAKFDCADCGLCPLPYRIEGFPRQSYEGVLRGRDTA